MGVPGSCVALNQTAKTKWVGHECPTHMFLLLADDREPTTAYSLNNADLAERELLGVLGDLSGEMFSNL